MKRYRVAVILDPNYGKKILELTPQMHVWVISSPVNDEIVYPYWKSMPVSKELNQDQGITLIGDKEILFNADLLDDIWIHHSDQWFDPPISEILVIGVELSSSVRAVLDNYGLDIIEETEKYFIARDRQ
jgi:hypothetical protein